MGIINVDGVSKQGFLGFVYFIVVCIELPGMIGLSKVYDDRLAEYEAKMRTGISPVGLVPLLEVPAGGFMTQEERIVVVSKESDPEKVSTIISTLRKKTDKDYFNFCNILENSGNAHWAKRLRVSESPIASLDMGMMTPMGTVLSESSSVQPDMETQRIREFLACSAMFLE